MAQKKPLPALPRNYKLIGWREHVLFEDYDLAPLTAKVDTGARSAALHAVNIQVQSQHVSFILPVGPQRYLLELPLIAERQVKSTSGHREMRPVVETRLRIGNDVFHAEVTLTDRTDMGVPMLLGRNTIRGRYVVHPSRSFIITSALRKTS